MLLRFEVDSSAPPASCLAIAASMCLSDLDEREGVFP